MFWTAFFFICLELMPIRIRQYDADPTRSRSTKLQAMWGTHTFFCHTCFPIKLTLISFFRCFQVAKTPVQILLSPTVPQTARWTPGGSHRPLPLPQCQIPDRKWCRNFRYRRRHFRYRRRSFRFCFRQNNRGDSSGALQ